MTGNRKLAADEAIRGLHAYDEAREVVPKLCSRKVDLTGQEFKRGVPCAPIRYAPNQAFAILL